MDKKSNLVFFIVGVIAGLAIMGLVWYGASAQSSNQGDTIKIGLMGPLTGDAAIYGASPKKGAEMAIEEINANGGINGKKLELIAEDSKCDGKEAVNAINKLTNVDKVKFIVGGMCSSETLAAAPIAETNKVVMVSPVSTNYKVSGAGDYIFRTVASDALQGKKAAELAYQMGFRKAAILYINTNDYGPGLEMVFKAEFAKLGGQVVISEGHSAGDSDFRTQLTKIKSANPDVLYLPSQMPENSLVVKQAKELGIACQIIGTETMQDEKFAQAVGGDAANGIIFTSFAEYKGSQADAFSAKFKAKFGEEKAIYSDYAYDAVYAIAKSMELCKNPQDSACVKTELYKTNFIGATGPVGFDENGDVKGKDFAVFKIENGKFLSQ
ncbi:MAG: ABC transporter substrate-binding protein [Candidatus Pacebacteria bacterium]|nr:ABC transporter substrate-binding protein [Candidatus Paceibacterota bacterium]